MFVDDIYTYVLIDNKIIRINNSNFTVDPIFKSDLPILVTFMRNHQLVVVTSKWLRTVEGGSTQLLQAWDGRKGGLIVEHLYNISNYYAVAVNEDGSLVAIGLLGGVGIFALDNALRSHVFSIREDLHVRALAFASRTELLIGDDEGNVWIRNIDENSLTLKSQNSGDMIWYLCISPNKKLMAMCSSQNPFSLFSFPSGELISQLPFNMTMKGFATFSNDNSLIAATDLANQLGVWNVQTHRLSISNNIENPIEKLITSITFSKDDAQIFTQDLSGVIQILNSKTLKLIKRIPTN